MSRRWILGFILICLWAAPLAYAAETFATSAIQGEAPPPAGDLDPQATPAFVPKEKVNLRINVPAAQLELYVNGEYKKTYKIAVGMPQYPTPIQDLNISYIIWNPWWLPPDSPWAKDAEKTPPGPGNPLGPVKMLLENGIRIHGTNAPGSIGHAASHACMRMYSKDAKELAWEIQQRYSEKNDPQLIDTYKKNSKRSYWIKLGEEVPVEINYKQAELKGDTLFLYPDRYSKGGFQNDLEEALASHPEVIVDKPLVKKLSGMRSKGNAEVELSKLKEQNEPPKVRYNPTEAITTKPKIPASDL